MSARQGPDAEGLASFVSRRIETLYAPVFGNVSRRFRSIASVVEAALAPLASQIRQAVHLPTQRATRRNQNARPTTNPTNRAIARATDTRVSKDVNVAPAAAIAKTLCLVYQSRGQKENSTRF